MKTYYQSLLAAIIALLPLCGVSAQSVTFDFDSAPQYSPLPIYLTAGGITGYFSSGTLYYNYSIQAANVLGFTPPGFSGLCIYPSTVYESDLLVSFDTQLNAASILYSPEEYGTDSSCTMRMTAYLGTTYVGTNTHQIPNGGTWPSGTLSFNSTQPFDNIVIHYDAPPPTGGDYGPIFMADNLIVTPFGSSSLPTVTLTVIDGSASEVPATDTGKVQIARTGATTSALTVFYKVTGTAKNGKDYRKLAGKAIIKTGASSVSVLVRPIDDTIPEPDETVIFTLSPNASYTIGSPSIGTVVIHSNE
jgi:Calx-beta domain